MSFIFLLFERHWDSQDRGLVALPAKTQTGTEPPGSCRSLFLEFSSLHKQHDSDVIIMMSWSSDSLFHWEKPLCRCRRVMLTPLCLCRCCWPTPYFLSWTTQLNFVSQFLWVWHVYILVLSEIFTYISSILLWTIYQFINIFNWWCIV